MSLMNLHMSERVASFVKALASFAISAILFAERSPSNGTISLLFPVLALLTGLYFIGITIMPPKDEDAAS